MEILPARLAGQYDRPGMYAAPPQRDLRSRITELYTETQLTLTSHTQDGPCNRRSYTPQG